MFFNASGSRPATGRTIVRYEWDFGKGTTGSGVTTSHIYDAVGTYTVTLTVTDDVGTVSTVSKPVAVTVAAPVVAPTSALLLTAPFDDEPTYTTGLLAPTTRVTAVQ